MKKFSPADRALVLIANRLIRPHGEHGLAAWLETDFVCDRLGRRFMPQWHSRGRVRVHHRPLDAWYRTLDQLLGAKAKIEVALYHRLCDLFSLRPDLVSYDGIFARRRRWATTPSLIHARGCQRLPYRSSHFG